VAAERALAIAAPAPLADRHRLVLDLAPVLFESGLPARARELLDDMLALVDERHPGPAGRYARGLLLAERAWLQWAEGDDEAAAAELARCWAEAGDAVEAVLRRTGRLLERPLWEALGREAIPAEEAMRALAAANPDGEPLLDFTRHPAAAVRHAALPLLAASGHPAFSRRAAELAGDTDPRVRAAAAARREPPPLRIAVLGGFRVGRGGWQADDGSWGRRVAQRLVRFLLVHGPDPVPEDLLLEAFWPDKAPRAARHSLQTAVSSARRVLDAPGAGSVVEAGERGYRLRLERDAVDCERFERAAAAALVERGPQRIRLLAAADALWSGEPLPEERFADWADAWRRRLGDRHVAVLTALAQDRLAAGDVPDATRAARRLVEQDPLNEAGHRTLMTAYARAGRRSEALRQYLECRRALVQQLGVEPAAETADLQRRILAGEPV
jgi:DNA-binding SARP family transcriptional activator